MGLGDVGLGDLRRDAYLHSFCRLESTFCRECCPLIYPLVYLLLAFVVSTSSNLSPEPTSPPCLQIHPSNFACPFCKPVLTQIVGEQYGRYLQGDLQVPNASTPITATSRHHPRSLEPAAPPQVNRKFVTLPGPDMASENHIPPSTGPPLYSSQQESTSPPGLLGILSSGLWYYLPGYW